MYAQPSTSTQVVDASDKKFLNKYKQPHPVVRNLYLIPGEQSLVRSTMQNVILCALGGLQQECPQLLYKSVPKETALMGSNCQTYINECAQLGCGVHIGILEQLSTTAGRYNLYDLNCAGQSLGDVGVKALFPLIERNVAIRSISLRLCNLQNSVAEVLQFLDTLGDDTNSSSSSSRAPVVAVRSPTRREGEGSENAPPNIHQNLHTLDFSCNLRITDATLAGGGGGGCGNDAKTAAVPASRQRTSRKPSPTRRGEAARPTSAAAASVSSGCDFVVDFIDRHPNILRVSFQKCGLSKTTLARINAAVTRNREKKAKELRERFVSGQRGRKKSPRRRSVSPPSQLTRPMSVSPDKPNGDEHPSPPTNAEKQEEKLDEEGNDDVDEDEVPTTPFRQIVAKENGQENARSCGEEDGENNGIEEEELNTSASTIKKKVSILLPTPPKQPKQQGSSSTKTITTGSNTSSTTPRPPATPASNRSKPTSPLCANSTTTTTTTPNSNKTRVTLLERSAQGKGGGSIGELPLFPPPPFALSRHEFNAALSQFQLLMNKTTCWIDMQAFHDKQPHSYNLVRKSFANRVPPIENINFIVFLEATFPMIPRSELIRSVEQYSEYAFVQHVAGRTTVDTLRLDQKQEIREMFDKLDKDADGILNKDELYSVLSEAGREAADLVLERMRVDHVTFQTFVSLTAPYLLETKRRKRWR